MSHNSRNLQGQKRRKKKKTTELRSWKNEVKTNLRGNKFGKPLQTIIHIYFSPSVLSFIDGWELRMEYKLEGLVLFCFIIFVFFDSPSIIINLGGGIQSEQRSKQINIVAVFQVPQYLTARKPKWVHFFLVLIILNCDNSDKLGKCYLYNRKIERRPEPLPLGFSVPNPKISQLAVREEWVVAKQKFN